MQKEDKVCNITPANRVGSVQEYYFSISATSFSFLEK